jgi:hypothetical protein
MRRYLKNKVAAPVYKTEINGRGVSAALTTRHPSIRRIGIKIGRQIVVVQSVEFACGLKATEFVCLFVSTVVASDTR